MNNVFTAKLLQNLNSKKGEKGFTLIELLVVVIIVGVLAAVALPNLLGQVGKARETEGKNAIGTLNRGQQTYHFDAKIFVPATAEADFQTIRNPFGVALISDVYDFAVDDGTATTSGPMTATPVDANDDGVRGFAGQVDYVAADGTYGMAVCQGTQIGLTPATLTINVANPQSSTCDGVVIK